MPQAYRRTLRWPSPIVTQAIDNVLYETSIRREMFAQTATVLLGSGQARTQTTAATPIATPNDTNAIENGQVKP